MKKISFLFALCVSAILSLTACGETVGNVSFDSQEAVDALAEVTTEVSATEATTEASTQTVYTEPPVGANLPVNKQVEVYEKITLSQLLEGANVTLDDGDTLVDTSELGELEVTVSYSFEGDFYKHPVTYTVKDTTPPVLLNSGEGAYVEVGTAFDLSDYVGFADNYDKTPELTYTGTVDTSTCGIYNVSAVATDDSGNSTPWNLRLIVVNEEPEPEDDNERRSFDAVTMEYAGDNVSFGIDVSKWQGEIDFNAVKNAGCDYVIMRIGTFYDEYAEDTYFAQNLKGAKEAGLDVGVYIYTTANSEAEARDNAQWIIDTLDGEKLDFPVVFDWESFSNFQQYEMSIDDLNNYFLAFADELESNGYSAMLYSSKNFLNNFWYEHEDYPKWLAHYTRETDYKGEYSMWQLTCYGRIDGIGGDVDFNILYTDMPMN